MTMKRILAGLMVLSLSAVGLLGCSEKSTMKTERTVTTPQGETKVTTETEVKKSGENPPPAN
jgi:hypothetical protein